MWKTSSKCLNLRVKLFQLFFRLSLDSIPSGLVSCRLLVSDGGDAVVVVHRGRGVGVRKKILWLLGVK